MNSIQKLGLALVLLGLIILFLPIVGPPFAVVDYKGLRTEVSERTAASLWAGGFLVLVGVGVFIYGSRS